MGKRAFWTAWILGLSSAALALLAWFLGLPDWEALAVVPVGTAAVGYGVRAGALVSAAVLVFGFLREAENPADLTVLALALAMSTAAGHATREILRARVRRERRMRKSLDVFLRALDRVVEKERRAEVLAALPENLAEAVDANVSVWVPSGGGFVAVAARGLTGLDRIGPEGVIGRAFRAEAPVYVEDVTRAPEFIPPPDGEQRAELALPLFCRGTPVAVLDLGRRTPFHPLEVETLKHFAEAVSHHLTLLAENFENRLTSRLTQGVASADDLEQAAAKAVGLLLEAFDLPGGGLWVWRRGRFRPLVIRDPEGPAWGEGLAPGQGPLWRVYLERRPLFFDDLAGAEGIRLQRARALALHPVRGQRRGRVILALRDERPREWTGEERRVLAVVARALDLALAQFEYKDRLETLLGLEQALPEMDEAAFYQRLLEAAVDQVPGAEAGSLLVRGEGGFGYRAAVGYPLEELARIRYAPEDMAQWCGGGWADGRPRLLTRKEVPLEEVSHRTAPAEIIDRAGRIREMQQNLCVPVRYRGEVLAVLNLDAFADPEAFDAESVEVAHAFAVQVAAMLHEAGYRRFLETAALTDPLTGLANRRAFDRLFAAELARARREGRPLSLVVLDLTRFKEVNDRFGHPAGDRALVRVARAMEGAKRASDLLFRWGGDEFALILPGTDRAGARNAAERYARAIQSVCLEGVCLGVNMGVASCPEDADDGETLLRLADDRMYRAKAQGVPLVA